MKRAENKANRLLQEETLLLAHPEGLTRAELARRLRVNRSTVTRDLPDLGERFAVYEEPDGRLKIDRDAYLVRVSFSQHEALAVHLGARLLATWMDRQNPHAAAALRKLGLSLERLAPLLSRHVKQSADVMDGAAQWNDPGYLDVLETLTRAWSAQRKVKIWHQQADGGIVSQYTFAPYFIEPYAVGQATHVMGFREPPGKLRTFKVERIKRIEMLADAYTIPAEFDPSDLLSDAWGIWYTEAEPVRVVLRFHPQVVSRIRETRWHLSEETEVMQNGYLIWRARIAEPREMLPWIRGWGADCEVLEPAALRAALFREANRLARVYDLPTLYHAPAFRLLWAKTDRKTGQMHRLIYHLIDVAQVAAVLWEEVFPQGVRRQFADWLGTDENSAGKWVAFWAGLHDLGKASPAFQRKYAPAIPELEGSGLDFPVQLTAHGAPHGLVSTFTLSELLHNVAGMDRMTAKHVAQALGGHHGAWPTSAELQPHKRKASDLGGEAWDVVRGELFKTLQQIVGPPKLEMPELSMEAENARLTMLSGVVSVADWLGSMENYFTFQEEHQNLADYAAASRRRAEKALQEQGWLRWKPSNDSPSFTDLFPHPQPREMQRQVIDRARTLRPPALLIVESPTGGGKTEAALAAADALLSATAGRGLYIAMPTMATSNQMYERFKAFLDKRYPGQNLDPLLLHSQAQWVLAENAVHLKSIGEGLEDELDAQTWFLPRKRSLLAPFAVGTVDQSLMSVLQTRHFFVRLFGLSHKVVIFDEVHAYDTYMNELFHRLLAWLRQIGTSVIVLSATLPEATREALASAYTGQTARPQNPAVSYPRLTWAAKGETGSAPLPPGESRSVAVEWLDSDPAALTARLKEELEDGGCAAVICNTVRKAQMLYEFLDQAGIVPKDDLILFHARFPFAWRDKIEQTVRQRFGKDGAERPQRAIVIATQVIEQSLDLDFDVMVSELAPIDLLLQRAGRLHRHDRRRPKGLRAPRMILLQPEKQDDLPVFKRNGSVYDPYVLLQTYRLAAEMDRIRVPEDVSRLIEEVYAAEPIFVHLPDKWRRALAVALEEMRAEAREEKKEARFRLVRSPKDEDLLGKASLNLDEENPGVHQTLKAMTRLIEQNVSVICLHETPQGLALEPNGEGGPIDLENKPDRDTQSQLLRYSVTITHRGVVNALLAKEPPPAWQRIPALRYYRPAIFRDGRSTLEGTPFTLYLTQTRGLEVKEGG